MFKNLNASALGVTGHQSEIIELALTYRFRGFDLDIEDFANRVKRRGLDYAARLIRSANIGVGTFTLPLDWDTEDDVFKAELAKLPECAQAAADVGCTRCVATISPAGDKRPYHESFEFHRRRFAEICAALAPAGVTFGVGFRAAPGLRKARAFQFIHDLDAAMLLLNMTDAENIGLLLDVWDLTVSGASIDNVGSLPIEQIVAVRVANLPEDVPAADATEESRLLPGGENGQIDVPAYLKLLSERGYDGPVTPVPHRGIFGKPRREMVVKRAGEAMDAVWRAAGLLVDHRAHAPAGSK